LPVDTTACDRLLVFAQAAGDFFKLGIKTISHLQPSGTPGAVERLVGVQ
jgi:hypothetical protein